MVVVNSIECFPWQKWSQHLFKCSGEAGGASRAAEEPSCIPSRAGRSHPMAQVLGARGAAKAERWSLELLLLVQLVDTSGSRDGR